MQGRRKGIVYPKAEEKRKIGGEGQKKREGESKIRTGQGRIKKLSQRKF